MPTGALSDLLMACPVGGGCSSLFSSKPPPPVAMGYKLMTCFSSIFGCFSFKGVVLNRFAIPPKDRLSATPPLFATFSTMNTILWLMLGSLIPLISSQLSNDQNRNDSSECCLPPITLLSLAQDLREEGIFPLIQGKPSSLLFIQ